MPRTKAISTRAKEIAKELRPDQIRQLAELLNQEAEKPQLDKKAYNRLQREIKTAYARLTNAEEGLSTLLAESGKDNDEINREINELRRDAERERLSGEKPKRRGRPRKAAESA